MVRRDVHDGIVGARLRGAQEAIYPIILFLDSHAEVCDGWLEPLAARIGQDRTRVVIPNIRGVNIDTLGERPRIRTYAPAYIHRTRVVTHTHTHTHTHIHTHTHTLTYSLIHSLPHTHTHTHDVCAHVEHIPLHRNRTST